MHSTTFTPDAAGTLVVTVTFDAQGLTGGDWGASYSTKTFCAQSSVTSYGDARRMSTTRANHTIRGVFDVVAGSSCEVGIYGAISGAVAASWWDIHITAELIKR